MKSLLKIAFVAALSSLIAACGPQGNKNATQSPQAQSQNMTDNMAHKHGRGHKLRAVCADEIQKYCASGTKVRKCLQQNMDKLGDRCKTRLSAILERRRERKELRQYNATHLQGQQSTGTTPQGQMQQQPQGQMQQQQTQPNKAQSDDDDDDDQ
ncbi:MAG: hypothetical protein WBQ17_07045 [Rhizomicrobium sp.]